MTSGLQRRAPRARMTRALRREQLLDVTKRIVGEAGLHGVSIDRIAREAGISRPIVYEHFQDLGGVLRALLEREGSRALAQLGQALPPAGVATGATDLLLSALGAFLAAVAADPVTWRLVLMPPEGVPEFLRDGTENARAAVTARLAELVAGAAPPRGGSRSPDPELTAGALAALAEHWARLMLTDPAGFPASRLLEHARWALSRFAP